MSSIPRINFEKIVRADRERVFDTVTSYGELHKMLPQYFPSIRVRSRRGNVAIVEEHMRVAGKELVMMTKHVTDAPRIHEVFVVGGDAKGTHIIERYEQVSEGTKVTVEADIKLGGTMKIAGLFGRRKINRDLQGVVDSFARILED